MAERIILMGFMGSGKTVVGRALAAVMGWDFVDTDERIEDVTGLSIMRLLDKYGETRFRSEEELVLKKLLAKDKIVIATGGSLDLQNHNLQLLSDGSFFVLLQASPEVLLDRLCRKNNRPFLGKKPDKEKITQMLAQRAGQFEAMADFSLNTSGISVDEAAAQIAAAYEKR